MNTESTMYSKVALYVSPTSLWGIAFLKAALECRLIKVQMVTLPSAALSWNFYLKLSKIKKSTQPDVKFLKKHRKGVESALQLVRKSNIDSAFRIIDDANTTHEAALLHNFELVLTAAFPQIFKKIFFTAALRDAINFHPSYLPRCQGANPVYWTIAKREDYAGVSSHYITSQIDRGPILQRTKVDFNKETITYSELYSTIITHLPNALAESIRCVHNGSTIDYYEEVPIFFFQNKHEDHRIVWESETVDEICAKIRASNAFSILHSSGRLVNLSIPASVSSPKQYHEIGKIIKTNKGMVYIQCKGGMILCVAKVNGVFISRLLSLFKRYKLPFISLIQWLHDYTLFEGERFVSYESEAE